MLTPRSPPPPPSPLLLLLLIAPPVCLPLKRAPPPVMLQLLATDKVMLSADCFADSENNFVPVEMADLPSAAQEAEVSA